MGGDQKLISPIQHAVNVAINTFSDPFFATIECEQQCKEHLSNVMNSIDQLKKEDLGVTTRNPLHPTHVFSSIVDSSLFHFSIFYVKKGEKLPLHNHPGMIGIIKILYGDVLIRSYTPQVQKTNGLRRMRSRISCHKTEDKAFTAESKPILLSPFQSNIHEITALSDFAFFDCLAPPYSDANNCTFFKLTEGYNVEDSEVELVELGQDASYTTVVWPYTGDKIIVP